MAQMKCPACGEKGGYGIWHCSDCGDTRCTKSGCRICKSKNVKRIN